MRRWHDQGLDILGAEVFGMLDIQQAQRNMNALKPVTIDVARILVNTASDVINHAIAAAKQPWYKADIPGATTRENVKSHLDWHRRELSTKVGDGAYASGDDLKKWAMQAFIEANAVEETSAYLSNAWDQMWAEIQQKLLAIPRSVGQAAGAALVSTAKAAGQGVAEGAAESMGIPTWLFWVGGGLAVGFVGYAALRWRR